MHYAASALKNSERHGSAYIAAFPATLLAALTPARSKTSALISALGLRLSHPARSISWLRNFSLRHRP